jgi:hypothetical protein
MQQRQAYKTGAGRTRLEWGGKAAGGGSIGVVLHGLHGQIKPLR